MLIEHIIAYVKGITQEGTRMMLCLMCAKGREIFYENAWIYRKTDTRTGTGNDTVYITIAL